nr:hypothetical protein [Verrucomicrobiota bacterium]
MLGVFLLGAPVRAQQAAPPQAIIKMKTGTTQQGIITGVTPRGVDIRLAVGGSITVPSAQIERIDMPAPLELGQVQQAFAAKDYPKALSLLLALTSRYKGLPTDWAQLATGMLGEVYVALNDVPKAEAAIREFQQLYPGQGSLQGDVGMARIAVSRKDFASAKAKLEPHTEKALTEKNVPRAQAYAYSQAFYALGQVKESEGNAVGALEDYLRTVTIFYHDPTAVA